MQEAISACLEEDLLSRVQASELPYSLLIDESTDLSTQKHLIMYIMFWDGTVNTHFLANLPIEDCSATGILSTVEEFLKVKRLPLSNCFGFGSDGASVMTGCGAGVATLLKQKNPYIVSLHCIAHKLALVASQAADSVDYLKKYSKCMSAVYSFFSRSPNRTSHLKEIQNVVDDPKLAMKQFGGCLCR